MRKVKIHGWGNKARGKYYIVVTAPREELENIGRAMEHRTRELMEQLGVNEKTGNLP